MNVGPKPLAIVRFGSLATACAGSFTIVRFGSLATACIGSCFTGCAVFFVLMEVRFFVIAFIGLSAVLGADFCVIT